MVVDQGGPEFFDALPLALQFLDVRHAEVMMHLFRYIVRGPGRSRQGRDLLEGEHAVSRRVEQDQPVQVVVVTVGGDLIARAVPETEQVPVELRETAAGDTSQMFAPCTEGETQRRRFSSTATQGVNMTTAATSTTTVRPADLDELQSETGEQLGISQMHVSRMLAEALAYLRSHIVEPVRASGRRR